MPVIISVQIPNCVANDWTYVDNELSPVAAKNAAYWAASSAY